MGTMEGRVAVVTGAGGGVGKAIALALARAGARLCLVGRRPEALLAVAAEAGRGAAIRCFTTDLADADALEALVARLQREFDRVDVLVHAAGVRRWGAMDSAPPAHLDEHYRTNVRAPHLLTRGLSRQLEAAGGQVVFLNAEAGLQALPNAGQYAASMHALRALADTLRQEFNPRGVRVLSLYLGGAGPQFQPADVAEVALHMLTLAWTIEVTEVRMRPHAPIRTRDSGVEAG